MGESMVSIKGLHFQYEHGSNQVLKDINLEIPQGSFLGITGPSGAGKSTLLQTVNGIIPHYLKGEYYGHVAVDGKDTFEASLTDLSKIIGTVFQDIDSQIVTVAVEDEILYGLENFGIPKQEMEARLLEALTLVGITSLRYRSIRSLSGGQKQKVALASVIALKPRILLLDEPTGELDPGSSRQIFSLLKELNEAYGITVIVVEQKIMLLCEFAKELAVLDQGAVACHGPVREVLRQSSLLEQIGVQCPRVVTLSNAMEKRGYQDKGVCLNINEAKEMVRRSVR